jgi:hypothetical protein
VQRKLIQLSQIIFFAILVLSSSNPSQAKVSNDFGNWNFTTITVPINDKFSFQEVINTRVQENFTDLSILFLRSGLAYHLTPHVSLWLGHDWFGFYNQDFSHKNTIWEQVLITHKYRKYSFLHRIRQEQNLIPHDGDIATLRYLARVDRPMPLIKNKKVTLIIWDEAFVNFNSNNTNNAGFAENRIFTGAGYQFNKNLALELGYMLQYLNKNDDVLNHWLFSNLVINL